MVRLSVRLWCDGGALGPLAPFCLLLHVSFLEFVRCDLVAGHAGASREKGRISLEVYGKRGTEDGVWGIL